MMNATLHQKVTTIFGELAVDKQEALRAGLKGIPRFVAEFLLANGRTRGKTIAEVLAQIDRFSIDASKKNGFVFKLMSERVATLMARLEVEPKPHLNAHFGQIDHLDGHPLVVSESLIKRWPGLLYRGGLWGTVRLRYDPDTGPKPTISVEEFVPYQLTTPDVSRFRQARRHFTLEEWTDLLITSAGYRPSAFRSFRNKLLLLSRMVPLVEKNVYMVEMGPRQTGKSYLLMNLSPSVYVLAGAKATSAMLLYNLATKTLGIVGTKKVAVFDEIGKTSFPDLALVLKPA